VPNCVLLRSGPVLAEDCGQAGRWRGNRSSRCFNVQNPLRFTPRKRLILLLAERHSQAAKRNWFWRNGPLRNLRSSGRIPPELGRDSPLGHGPAKWEVTSVRHPALLHVLNDPRLRKIPFGVMCAIAVFLTTPATYGQRAARSHFGGPINHSRMGMSSRPSRGVPSANVPGGYRHVPASLLQIPVSNGGPRLRLQFRRGSYLGYGFWPLYGWASSWEADCAPYSGWDCYGDDYSVTETGEPAMPPPSGHHGNP
jgi:hypothetical protein